MLINIYVFKSKVYTLESDNVYAEDFVKGMQRAWELYSNNHGILRDYVNPDSISRLMLEVYKLHSDTLTEELQDCLKALGALGYKGSTDDMPYNYGETTFSQRLKNLEADVESKITDAIDTSLPFNVEDDEIAEQKNYNLTADEALQACSEGNFITHKSFNKFASIHLYGEYLYKSNGDIIPNANSYFTERGWATDGWRVKYPSYQINVARLDDMHKKATDADVNYNDCVMEGIKVRKRLQRVRRVKQKTE